MKIGYRPYFLRVAEIRISYWVTELPKVNRLLRSLSIKKLSCYTNGWIKQEMVIYGWSDDVKQAYQQLTGFSGGKNA